MYEELSKRGYKKLGVVSGSDSMYSYSTEKLKQFEPLLERFCPFTKLFIGKNWPDYTEKKTVESIVIDKPEEFWKASKYMLIVVE